MFLARLAASLRYIASIGLATGFIVVSLMMVIEAPNGAARTSADGSASAATLKRVTRTSALPQLTPEDFDIARAVPVDIKGKVEPPRTLAPTTPKAGFLASPAAQMASVDAASAPTADSQAVVTGDAVNVRAEPRKNSTKLFVARSGEVVDVFESVRGWTRIVRSGGETGWIATKFLRQ